MSSKAFAVIESLDSPAGAILVRYQVVERIEPDQEEARVAKLNFEKELSKVSDDLRDAVAAQLSAVKAMTAPKPSYRAESKMVVCATPEEVGAAIKEAKEADDEIRRLRRSGAHIFVDPTLRSVGF